MAFLLVNALGLVLAIACWALARRSRRAAFVIAVALLLGVVGKSALTHEPAWEAALFPWPGYIYLQGYWLYALGGSFFALAGPLLPLPRNQRAIAWLAAAVLLAGGISTSWMIHQAPLGEDRHADAHHHCQQSTGFTCAPTACVCALSWLGIDASEREMARLCLTRESGSTRFNTYRGLTLKLAGTAWCARMVEVPAEDLCVEGLVSVIDVPEQRHAITVRGDGVGVTVHDPLALGPEPWTLAELRRRYGGLAIECVPLADR